MPKTDHFLTTGPLFSRTQDGSVPLIFKAKLAIPFCCGAQKETVRREPSCRKWPKNFEQWLPILSFDLLYRSYNVCVCVSGEGGGQTGGV